MFTNNSIDKIIIFSIFGATHFFHDFAMTKWPFFSYLTSNRIQVNYLFTLSANVKKSTPIYFCPEMLTTMRWSVLIYKIQNLRQNFSFYFRCSKNAMNTIRGDKIEIDRGFEATLRYCEALSVSRCSEKLIEKVSFKISFARFFLDL